MPFGDRNFDFGVNLPWINDANGWDLGRSPYYRGDPYYDQVRSTHDIVDTYFADIAAKGFKVVRFWVFEKLEGLVFDPSNFDGSRYENLNSDADHRRDNVPDVIGLDPALERNAVTVMERAVAHGLEIYWCLLSVGNVHKHPEVYHSWAVSHLVNDEDLVDHFVEHALTPFLDAVRPFRHAVYAIDLMNEPEGIEAWWGAQATFYAGRDWDFSTEWEYYFQKTSRIVRDKGFKSSIGFQMRRSITENVAKLSPFVDFFDFHEYNSDGSLDEYDSSDFDSKPCIVGECGFRQRLSTSTNQSGEEQRDTLRNFMRNALSESDRTHGYAGVLPWYYSPIGGNDLNLLDPRSFNLYLPEFYRPPGPPEMILPVPRRRTTQQRYEELYTFLEDLRRQPNHYWRSVDDGGRTPREEIEDFAARVAIINGATP